MKRLQKWDEEKRKQWEEKQALLKQSEYRWKDVKKGLREEYGRGAVRTFRKEQKQDKKKDRSPVYEA